MGRPFVHLAHCKLAHTEQHTQASSFAGSVQNSQSIFMDIAFQHHVSELNLSYVVCASIHADNSIEVEKQQDSSGSVQVLASKAVSLPDL